MSNLEPEARAAPFESARELQEEHQRLLELIDQDLGDDTSTSAEEQVLARHEARIRAFLERGAATGVYLDEVRDRTACQVLLDYWVVALSRAGRTAPGIRLARFDEQRLPELKDEDSPYVGLESFRSPQYFFGREGDTRQLWSQVRDVPLVVVLGASGSGKSSLVMGGVLPAIRADTAQPALRVLPPFVPGIAVLDALAEAVRAFHGATAPVDPAGLRADPRHLSAALGGAEAPPTLITIDQFEEVFTLAGAADRDALVANLATVLTVGRGHRVLLSMREEFRSRMVELLSLGSYLDQAWYSMRPMSYDELRTAVEQPATLANLHFQPGIVDDLVKKVLGQPAALPLLQFTLRALWEHRWRNRITWDIYRQVGDPLNALKSSADRFLEGLAQQTQDEVRRVLLELVRVDELLEAYRQPVLVDHVLQAGKANTEEVLRLLVEKDFLRATPALSAEKAVIELKHEALVRNWPRLVGWIDQKRYERRQRLALTQAATQWAKSGRPPQGLFTGWQLQEAERQPDLSDLEREFVKASADAVDRERREQEAALRREAEQAQALALKERKLRRLSLFGLCLTGLGTVVLSVGSIHFQVKYKDLKDRTAQLEKSDEDLNKRVKDLEQEKKKYQDENLRLQDEKKELEAQNSEIATSFAKSVVTFDHLLEGHDSKARKPVKIYLHISEDSQRPQVDKIAEALKKGGIEVPDVPEVLPVPKSTVRYFHEQDEAYAERIMKLLDAYLVDDPLLQKVSVPRLKSDQAQFEIWFESGALDALAPEKTDPLSPGSATYLIVLSSDEDCSKAVDSYLTSHDALARALGSEFRHDALTLVRDSGWDQQYFVTAYGGHLSFQEADGILQTIQGQQNKKSDKSDSAIALEQLYQEQHDCRVEQQLRSRLYSFADAYRKGMKKLEDLSTQMRSLAPAAALNPKEIEDLYRQDKNPEDSRIAALAAILGAPKLEHLSLLLQSIKASEPDSKFEQLLALQALKALVDLKPAMPPEQRQSALTALQQAWAGDTGKALKVKFGKKKAEDLEHFLQQTAP